MLSFQMFIDKKEREAKKQLKIIEHILKSNGFKVNDHLDDDDPYIFVKNPEKDTFFDGIRIYKIGSNISFRVQKQEKTEPFGKAYDLPIEEMFTDLISDYKPHEAGEKIIQAVTTEVKKFFVKSHQAEKELRDKEFDRGAEPFGKVVVRSSDYGMDYSNLTYMKA